MQTFQVDTQAEDDYRYSLEFSVKRLFLLGAGASCPYGLPNMKQLFWELLHFVSPGEGETLRRAAYEACDCESFEPDHGPDFEELISRLDPRAVRYLREPQADTRDLQGPRDELVDAARIALEGLRAFILSRCRAAANATGPYDALIAALRPTDAIVSFNWDVLLEMAFRRAGNEYTYIADDPGEAALVLKPHGSINWYAVLDHHLPMIDASNAEWVGGDTRYYMVHLRDPLGPLDDKGYAPLLAPCLSPLPAIVHPRPTMTLSFGETDTDGWTQLGHEQCMRVTWDAFQQIVRQVEEIVVIGYSLPGTDIGCVEVLKRFAHDRRVKGLRIIDPADRVVERFRRIVHRDAERIATDFADLDMQRL